MVKCVVTSCPNRTDTSKGSGPRRASRRFFSFPRDPARVKVWLAALRESERLDSADQHVICEDHFLAEHVTALGVSDDAIPIMPPYLDGPLEGPGALASPWGAQPSSEDEEEELEEEEEMKIPGLLQMQQESQHTASDKTGFHGTAQSGGADQHTSTRPRPRPRGPKGAAEVALGPLTRRFLELLRAAPGGVLDLRHATSSLHTHRRRVYDITNVLHSISLITKESTNRIKWIGKVPVCSFSAFSLQRELSNMKVVEESLDQLIRSCAQQLFELTDQPDNATLAYVSQDDLRRIPVFQQQTLLLVKAPEETKLEVPAPQEDRIQVHLRASRGPITVTTSEIGPPEPDTYTLMTLEESRVNTHTAPAATQSS